jgi:hypothetical protein
MRTTIEFGGFYGSVHEQLVESAVEAWHMDFDGNIETDKIDDHDWRESYIKYMREWTKIFSEWLKDDYDLDLEFTNLELISPKYYNFKTDTIDADVNLTEREATDLLGKFDNETDFREYLKQATTSYDGYISFYDYEQARENKDGVGLQFLLRYLANKFNERDLFDYYDRYNCYERIA